MYVCMYVSICVNSWEYPSSVVRGGGGGRHLSEPGEALRASTRCSAVAQRREKVLGTSERHYRGT